MARISPEFDEYYASAEFYDWVVPYRERKDVGFYVEMAKESGGPVLELGCGTGRILLPIARAGITITGLDRSPGMLSVCRERLAREQPPVRERVRLVQGDMSRFEFPERFGLITTPFRSFQHLLTTEDQMSCLACAKKHLRPGGRIILDLFSPAIPLLAADNLGKETGHEPEFTMPDGRRVVRCVRSLNRDFNQQIISAEMIYDVTHPDGRKERRVHPFELRFLFRYEAEHLLERCGFRLEAVYADYDRSAFGSKYPSELICVARAPQ